MTAEAKKALTPEQVAEKQNRAVCRAIFAMRDDLDLTNADVARILSVTPKTLGRWQDEGRIPSLDEKHHLREAASHLISIFRSLSAMFSNGKDREAWIKTRHPELAEVPLDIMKGSMEGIIQVRRYLDYVRGRGA